MAGKGDLPQRRQLRPLRPHTADGQSVRVPQQETVQARADRWMEHSCSLGTPASIQGSSWACGTECIWFIFGTSASSVGPCNSWLPEGTWKLPHTHFYQDCWSMGFAGVDCKLLLSPQGTFRGQQFLQRETEAQKDWVKKIPLSLRPTTKPLFFSMKPLL